jgi:serine/threonine-protein kinase
MVTRRVLGVAAAAGVAVAMLLAAAPSRAQSTDDKAAAEAQFDEGKRLIEQKKFAEACPRFEASLRLDPGIGTRLFLADCYEGLGRVASAWAMFREAAAAARTAGQAEREKIARSRAALLEPRLFKLTITVAAPDTPGLKVQRNDAAVKKDLWSLDFPVDPGAFTLRATAPGKKPWSTSVTIPEGAGARSIAVPALEDDPAAAKGPAVEPRAEVVSPPPVKEAESGWGPQRVSGVVLGGAGLLALGIGAGFGAQAMSKNNQAKMLCPSVKCGDQSGVDLSHQAGTAADLATGMFVVGGVILAGGVVLVVTAPKPSAPPAAWIAPLLGSGTAGLSAGRTW